MKIVVNGISANLRFSSAHIIPTHDFCGCIHGHSYFVDVEIEGDQSGAFDFVIDFKDIKKSVRKICKEHDHKLLIPIFNSNIKFKFADEDINFDFFEDKEYVEFNINGKEYKIPKIDVVLLPLKHSSAEELAKYFTELLIKDISPKENISSVAVGVNEGIGQGAFFKINLI
ncbi:MAG: 6-carboxytetrahydropterin synthase [Methanobrevibacter sp. CfCl-M3]